MKINKPLLPNKKKQMGSGEWLQNGLDEITFVIRFLKWWCTYLSTYSKETNIYSKTVYQWELWIWFDLLEYFAVFKISHKLWKCIITNFPFKDVKIFWWVATSSKSVIYTFAAHPSFHDILHLNQKQQCLLCYSFLLCCVYNFPIILHLSFQCTNVVQA